MDLPVWVRALLIGALGLPYYTYTRIKSKAKRDKTVELLQKTINECFEDLKGFHKALTDLDDVEKIIDRQDEIEKAFKNETLSLNALKKTMNNKIKAVSDAYERKNGEWKDRVESLKDRLSNPRCEMILKRNTLVLKCLLLDETIYCVEVPASSRELIRDNLKLSENAHFWSEDACLWLDPDNAVLIQGEDNARKFTSEAYKIIIKSERDAPKILTIRDAPKILTMLSSYEESLRRLGLVLEMDLKKPLFRTLLASAILAREEP